MKITLDYHKFAWVFSERLKNEFETVVVNKPSVFEPLKFYLVIGQLNEYQFFSAFHWSTSDTPPASQCITIQ